jgi:hypothetical protein
MPDQPILTAPIIGQTENALRALLGRALQGSGLDYHQWVALRVASTSTPPLGHTELRDRLQDGLKIDPSMADEAIDGLATRGLLFVSAEGVTASDEGATLYQRLDADVRRISAQVWKGIDGADLVAAYRVHSVVTERANALLAG